MGAESFYIKLFVSNAENTNNSIPYFLSKLADLKIKYKSSGTNEFELDNFLIMTLHLNNDEILEISIEGCFSWFHECMLEVYEVTQIIHNQIFHLKLINSNGKEIPFPDQIGFPYCYSGNLSWEIQRFFDEVRCKHCKMFAERWIL